MQKLRVKFLIGTYISDASIIYVQFSELLVLHYESALSACRSTPGKALQIPSIKLNFCVFDQIGKSFG